MVLTEQFQCKCFYTFCGLRPGMCAPVTDTIFDKNDSVWDRAKRGRRTADLLKVRVSKQTSASIERG